MRKSNMERRIEIRLEGGLITEIKGIPRGVVVEVRDYDIEGTVEEDSPDLLTDDDGNQYLSSEFESV